MTSTEIATAYCGSRARRRQPDDQLSNSKQQSITVKLWNLAIYLIASILLLNTVGFSSVACADSRNGGGLIYPTAVSSTGEREFFLLPFFFV